MWLSIYNIYDNYVLIIIKTYILHYIILTQLISILILDYYNNYKSYVHILSHQYQLLIYLYIIIVKSIHTNNIYHVYQYTKCHIIVYDFYIWLNRVVIWLSLL